MGNYSGPAVLVLPEGDVSVVANFTSWVTRGGLTDWSGGLASDEVDWHSIFGSESLTVRLPDGREGTVLIVRMTGGSSAVAVQGSGPVPF